MNKQAKYSRGVLTGRGIEWTDYTWNPIAGCFHACAWEMPDGAIANCYAEDQAIRMKSDKFYPDGFEHHYWKPELLKEPGKVKTPSRIFVGSMADVFGHWVPSEQIDAVLETARNNPQHTFQFLTKNPRRAVEFADHIPANCWIGASTPPNQMWNKPLSFDQRSRMFTSTLRALATLRQAGVTTWVSAEPLTIDAGAYIGFFAAMSGVRPIDWIVIGAASNGTKLYAPDELLVRNAVEQCDRLEIPVFYKGNLKTLAFARDDWREAFVAKEVAAHGAQA